MAQPVQIPHVVSPWQVITHTMWTLWMLVWLLPLGMKLMLAALIVLGVVFGNFGVSPAIRRRLFGVSRSRPRNKP